MPRPDYRSPQAEAYKGWYKLKIWADKKTGLRWVCLLKALFRCNSCGFQAKANETHKLVADHIKPHRGDWGLFSDPENLQCLCSDCHDKAKRQEELLGYSTEIGTDGWPVDDMHPANGGKPTPRPDWQGPMSHPVWFRPVSVPLTIVCGPPAAGKSTFVASHMQPGDILIELDAISKQRFGQPIRLVDTKSRMDCLRIRNEMLSKYMRKVDIKPRMVWLIATEPLAAARQWWADKVKPHTIIVLATPYDECLARAARDEEKVKRRGKAVAQSVREWWSRYTPREGDMVITPQDAPH